MASATERVWLDETSWVDVVREWMPREDADQLFRDLIDRAAWQESKLWRYETWVEEPRVMASPRVEGSLHPGILEAQREVRTEYKVSFDPPGVLRYRNGSDSVAFHRDRDMRWCENTLVAILTLGTRRPWYLRPKAVKYAVGPGGGSAYEGATHDVAPGSGDLVVMGGRCQADWEHAVPKVPRLGVGDRISLQWRWTSRTGQPEMGASYRAPRSFR